MLKFLQIKYYSIKDIWKYQGENKGRKYGEFLRVVKEEVRERVMVDNCKLHYNRKYWDKFQEGYQLKLEEKTKELEQEAIRKIQENVEDNKLKILLNQLNLKLNGLSVDVISKIENCSSEKIDKLSISIFDIQNEDDILDIINS